MPKLLRHLLLAPVLASVMLALAACGSGRPSSSRSPSGSTSGSPRASGITGTATGPSSSPISGLDPCSVIAPSEVAAAFGGTVAKGERNPVMTLDICDFKITGSNLGVDGKVQVFVLLTWTRARYESSKPIGLTNGDVVVPGIGDDALYDPNHPGVIFVKGAKVGLVATVFSPPAGTTLDPEKLKAETIAVARKAAAGF